MIKAYLFGSIFYEKDIVYNKILLEGIRKAWPGIDIYAPQEATINDKTTFANSKMIYDGDYERLQNTQLLIGCLDGDVPPIGSVTELGIFSELAKQDPSKKVVVLHTDSRDGYKTATEDKYNDLKNNQCASQFNYFNLFTRGAIEECGIIVTTMEQMFEYVHELYLAYIKTHHESGIYRIINRLSNKFYIGQAVDLPRRLNSHRYVKNDNPQAVDLAIQKYGIENFTFEVLEYCDKELLNEREEYWCNEYFSCRCYAPYGYNISRAGGQYGGKTGTVVSSYDLNGKLITTYESIAQAATECGVTNHAIQQAIDRENLSCGMMWSLGLVDNIDPYQPKPRGDKVKIYDYEGNFITICDNKTRAAEFLNVSISGVANVVDKSATIANHFIVSIDKDFHDGKYYKVRKKIYCYDKDSRKFIREFNDGAEALAFTDLTSSSTILKTIKGNGYYAGGYIWSYKKYDIIPANYKQINKQFWTSVKSCYEAEKETKVND